MSTKITAKINYSGIQDVNALTKREGVYIWVDPDNSLILGMQKLLHDFPQPKLLENCTEWHVTVIHSKASPEIPDSKFPKDRQIIKADLTKFELWTDHKQRKLLVARFESPELRLIHKQLIKLGLTTDFPDYDIHMTLAYNVDPELINIWVKLMNLTLRRQGPIPVLLGGTIMAAALG